MLIKAHSLKLGSYQSYFLLHVFNSSFCRILLYFLKYNSNYYSPPPHPPTKTILTTLFLLAMYIVTTFCWNRPSVFPFCCLAINLRIFLLIFILGSSLVVWFPGLNMDPQNWQATDGGVLGIPRTE